MIEENKAAGGSTRGAASNSPRGKSTDALLSRLDQVRRERQESQHRSAATREAISDTAGAAGRTQMLKDDAEIQRLAKLPPLEYDRVREKEAKRLGVRAGTLDDQVKRTRGEQNRGREMAGELFEATDAIPWPDPVDGAQLLDDLATSVRRFVVLPPHADDTGALWTMFTYLIDACNTSPILALVSPEKRCGKTTLIRWLNRVVFRPLPTSNISPPAVFRSIEKWHPSLLVDEADTFVGDNSELRGVLNSGHVRDAAFVVRCVGDDQEPRRFSTWCPKVFAAIGRLPDTLEDRSITVALARRLPEERVEKIRSCDDAEFGLLRRKLARWAGDHVDAVRQRRPDIPTALHDRAADNWEPLLAIAEVSGGDWPEKASQAALALSGAVAAEDSPSVELLVDIKLVFEAKRIDRIFTDELIKALCQDEERQWATYNKGKNIGARQLASRLKAFGIVSGTIRRGADTAKGYRLDQLAEPFRRYIPAATGIAVLQASQRHIPTATGDCGGSASVTPTDPLRIEETSNPTPDKACDGVTDKDGQPGARGAYRQREPGEDEGEPAEEGTV